MWKDALKTVSYGGHLEEFSQSEIHATAVKQS